MLGIVEFMKCRELRMRTRGRPADYRTAGDEFYALGVNQRRKGTAGEPIAARLLDLADPRCVSVIRKELCQ